MILEIMSGYKETDSRNRPNPTFWFGNVSPGMSEYTDSPELNSYSDTGGYVPADTISDSDVENVAAGPLAIFMLVLFVTVASSVLNSVFASVDAHPTYLVMIVLLMLTKGSRAMDPDEILKNGDFSAASVGIVGIGLALITGAAVHYGSKSDQARTQKVRLHLDDAGTAAGLVPTLYDDMATEGDVPALTATSDSDDEDDGDVPALAATSDSDDEDDSALVGDERHSKSRGLPVEASLQNKAPVSFPVLAVLSEIYHAISNHPAIFNRCATCHRKSKCDPDSCEYHLGLLQKVRSGY